MSVDGRSGARRRGLFAQLGGLLVVALGGFLLASSLAAGAAQGSITGHVVAATTGRPLSGICVVFYDVGTAPPTGAGSTQSGLDGTFSFQGAPAHAYDVAFFAPSRPGDCSSPPVATSFAPAWYPGLPLSTSLVPPPTATPVGAGTQHLDVCLGPRNPQNGCASATAGGTITGTVLTTGGAPEPNACLVVFAASNPTGPIGGAITSANGRYTLAGLPDATDLTIGFVPPFSGPGGLCDLSKAPPPPPPGALQPVWSGNVFFNLADPALGPNPYAASLAQGALIVHTGDTVDACLTSAPSTQVPRPPCVPVAAAPVAVTPRFTG